MESIKRSRSIIIWVFINCILFTLVFVALQKTKLTVACVAFSIISFVLLFHQSRLYSAAKLIYENRILMVPTSVVTTKNSTDKKTAEETIVSTFGLILGNKVYKWGCDGIRGVRLNTVQMDHDHIRLTFGVDHKRFSVEMLHCLTDKQSVIEIAKKILHETGVQTQISGW